MRITRPLKHGLGRGQSLGQAGQVHASLRQPHAQMREVTPSESSHWLSDRGGAFETLGRSLPRADPIRWQQPPMPRQHPRTRTILRSFQRDGEPSDDDPWPRLLDEMLILFHIRLDGAWRLGGSVPALVYL